MGAEDPAEEGGPPAPAEPPPGRRPRRPLAVETAADEAIRAAMARGDFDNLPGRGQPLRWDSERDDAWWLANHLLQNAGYRPAWIERDQAIRAEREALARMLAEHRAWHATRRGQEPAADLARAAEQLAGRYRERATALNREIDRHNLSVPLPSMQRPRLRVEAELSAFLASLDGEASA